MDAARAEPPKKRRKEHTPGIIYISRVPGTMGPPEMRRYFNDFGEVARMYLKPESEKMRAKRKKAGANVRHTRYTGRCW